MKGIKAIVSSILVFIVCSGVSLYADEVGVSFAKNNMVPAIRYYLSQDGSSESEIVVDDMTSPCYMEEGTTIYVRYNNPESSFYEFKGFKIYSYDEDGVRSDEIIEIDNKDQITIPSGLYYNQISIEPFGVFKQRTLNLSDTIDGEEKDNIWIIGDNEYTASSVDINAAIPYSVSFMYDPQLYYVFSYSPSNRVVSAGSGSVIFFEENPFAASRRNLVTDFSVQLKPYTYISFDSSSHVKRVLTTAGKEISVKELSSTPFEIGDTITIETERDWLLSGGGNVDIKNTTITDDSRIYTVTVTDGIDYDIKLHTTKTNTYTVNFSLPSIPENELAPYIELSAESESYDKYEDLQKKGSLELKDGDVLFIRIRNRVPSRQKMSIVLVYSDNHIEKFEIENEEYTKQFSFRNNQSANLKQLGLEIEYGIYFSSVKNDSSLIVRYYKDDGSELKDGDFLQDDTVIRFIVENCPDDKSLVFSDKVDKDKRNLTISSQVVISDFVVKTEPRQGFWFDPSEYSYEHGKVEFSVNGARIASRTFLENGKKLSYKSSSSEEGYHLNPDEISINGDLTEQYLRNIRFVEDEKITLLLPQPEYGGKIIYYYPNGEQIETDKIYVNVDDEINYVLEADNGFIPKDGKNEGSYKVPTNAKVQSIEVNNMFVENIEHQPSLTIDIHNTSSGFTIDTIFPSEESSLTIKNDSGEVKIPDGEDNGKDIATSELIKDGLFGSEYNVYNVKDVATYKATEFEIQGIQLTSNQALKITRSDVISGQEDPIITYTYVRASNTNYKLGFDYSSDSNRIYEHVDLTFEVVGGYTHEGIDIPHAELSVYVEGKKLLDGQFVEPDTEIEFNIKPDEDYYITGKGIENNCYQDSMTYSKYLKEIESIVREHSINKFITIYLPSNDSYGSYKYEFNDKEIHSVYNEFKVGDTIKVTFTVLPSYSIKRNLPFLSKNQITIDFEVEESMDGSEINLEKLGILVEGAAK